MKKCSHTYLSSTSWNTQLGVCVVVKTRLSVGILGALTEKKDSSKACILKFTQKNQTQTICMLLLLIKERKTVNISNTIKKYSVHQEGLAGAYLRNQSEPFRPAEDSRTGLQHAQCLGPSSGMVSCETDSTADRPRTLYSRCKSNQMEEKRTRVLSSRNDLIWGCSTSHWWTVEGPIEPQETTELSTCCWVRALSAKSVKLIQKVFILKKKRSKVRCLSVSVSMSVCVFA